jgi:DNA-binding response OmpR family regulator
MDVVDLKDGYLWDQDNQTLMRDNQPIHLSKKEKTLFEIMIQNRQQVFSVSLIADIFFSDDVSEDSIKSLVKRLRKKLPSNLIENIYGQGYKINIPNI